MIFFLGDIHGDVRPIHKWLENFAEKGDTLIQVGDFGIGFKSMNKWILEDLAKESKKIGVDILVIRGNHDSPQLFKDNLKIGNLEFLPDYTLREIEGKQIFFIGGAISIDRYWRVQDIDYWRGEEINMDLGKVQGIACDTVVTHSAPSIFELTTKDFSNIKWAIDADPSLLEELPKERNYLTDVFNTFCETKIPTNWWTGHFHISKIDYIGGCRFKCLNINELEALHSFT